MLSPPAPQLRVTFEPVMHRTARCKICTAGVASRLLWHQMIKRNIGKLFTADVTTTVPIFNNAFPELMLCYLTRY